EDELLARAPWCVKRNFRNETESENQHGISIAEEPIAQPDGFFICPQNMLPSPECTDQHQQGGARQVKIGDEGIHSPKAITRVNEKRSPAGEHRLFWVPIRAF